MNLMDKAFAGLVMIGAICFSFFMGHELGTVRTETEMRAASNTKIQNCLKIVGEIYE